MQALKKTGVEVVMVTEEQANEMLGIAEMQKRTAPETVSVQDEHLQTAISGADKRNYL